MLFTSLDFSELTEAIVELKCVIYQSSFDSFDNFDNFLLEPTSMHLSVSQMRIIDRILWDEIFTQN